LNEMFSCSSATSSSSFPHSAVERNSRDTKSASVSHVSISLLVSPVFVPFIKKE